MTLNNLGVAIEFSLGIQAILSFRIAFFRSGFDESPPIPYRLIRFGGSDRQCAYTTDGLQVIRLL
jgi:hypothetical protein